MLRGKEKTNSESYKSIDTLDEIILVQRNPHNLVKIATITGNSYIAFAYTEKQINDIMERVYVAN